MKTVCIQGLGYVGAAMAIAVASARDLKNKPIYDVIGVDLPNEVGITRIEAIMQGQFPFPSKDKNMSYKLSEAHLLGNLSATYDQRVYSDADIIIVDVQMDIPFSDDEPQLQFKTFTNAIKAIGQHVFEGTLIIVETTVPPGTCEKLVVPTLSFELLKRDLDPDSVLVAHSFERVMPGENYLESITNYWRVFSGFTKEAGDACEQFMKTVIDVQNYPLTRLSSTTASETAKVMENSYRAVNIAFIDEWTKYAESVGIDLYEVVEAIKKRPTHSNIRYPGLGVGGYCLTKDPAFAPAAAKQLFGKELSFPFSKKALNVNRNMPLHTADRLESLLDNSLKGKRILICGVSYMQDLGDTRYSPSETLIRKLISDGAIVEAHDPYLTYWNEMNLELQKSLPSSTDFDAVIFAVSHSQYRKLDLIKWANKETFLLDTTGMFDKNQREKARACGIRLESIGRADGL